MVFTRPSDLWPFASEKHVRRSQTCFDSGANHAEAKVCIAGAWNHEWSVLFAIILRGVAKQRAEITAWTMLRNTSRNSNESATFCTMPDLLCWQFLHLQKEDLRRHFIFLLCRIFKKSFHKLAQKVYFFESWSSSEIPDS